MINNSLPHLYQLSSRIKMTLFFIILNLLVGVGIGLYYLGDTTYLSIKGTSEHFIGSEVFDEFEIPEKYPKPISQLLTTTHNHILSLTFIFTIIGCIFYLNSIIIGGIKILLIIEPFISVLTTFGGIWLLWFGYPLFIYLIIISGILMYTCFFIMVTIILYELLLKK